MRTTYVQRGDMVTTPRAAYTHYGIIWGYHEGVPWIVNASKEHGKVVLESIDAFRAGETVFLRES